MNNSTGYNYLKITQYSVFIWSRIPHQSCSIELKKFKQPIRTNDYKKQNTFFLYLCIQDRVQYSERARASMVVRGRACLSFPISPFIARQGRSLQKNSWRRDSIPHPSKLILYEASINPQDHDALTCNEW